MDNLLNIRNLDIENEIKEAIASVKKELQGLDMIGTCKIYTSYLYRNLKKRNILCYVMDTQEDLEINYQHQFIVVPKNNDMYIVDLTYGQFKINEKFNKLYNEGYQLCDNELYNMYVDNIIDSVKKHNKR